MGQRGLPARLLLQGDLGSLIIASNGPCLLIFLARPMRDKIKEELAYYAQLKKNRENKLSELRKEFPDVEASTILDRYRTKPEHVNTSSDKPSSNNGKDKLSGAK